MRNEEEVRQASAQYYKALSSLLSGDAEPLVQAWSHQPDVTAMNPFGGREVGWEELYPVFEKVARLCKGGRVDLWLQDPVRLIGGDLAFESGIESGEGVLLGKPTTIRHRVTNIYRREAGEWKMVHRHTDLNPEEQQKADQLLAPQEEVRRTPLTGPLEETTLFQHQV